MSPVVDRRKEPRFQPNLPVTVTVLGYPPGPTLKGRVMDVSGSGIRLSVPLPVALGAPVKVEANETLSLGEVCRCLPDGDGYELGLQLSHTLTTLLDLDKAMRDELEHDYWPEPRTRS